MRQILEKTGVEAPAKIVRLGQNASIVSDLGGFPAATVSHTQVFPQNACKLLSIIGLDVFRRLVNFGMGAAWFRQIEGHGQFGV